MEERKGEISLNEMLFVALVRDFESMAMVGFGKLVDPVSQKAERNMERAKIAVDMLGMLEEKTKGNLSQTELLLMRQVLTNLRLNYIDELNKEEAEREARSQGGEAGTAAGGERERRAEDDRHSEGAEEQAASEPSASSERGGRAAREMESVERDGRADGEGAESSQKEASQAGKKTTKRKGKTGGGKGGKK